MLCNVQCTYNVMPSGKCFDILQYGPYFIKSFSVKNLPIVLFEWTYIKLKFQIHEPSLIF